MKTSRRSVDFIHTKIADAVMAAYDANPFTIAQLCIDVLKAVYARGRKVTVNKRADGIVSLFWQLQNRLGGHLTEINARLFHSSWGCSEREISLN